MEEYLETIVTVLIGLGVLLISALGKKKGSGTQSGENGEVPQYIEEDEEYQPFASNEINNFSTDQRVEAQQKEDNNNNEATGAKTRISKKQDQKKQPVKQKVKHKFNARKAIVYSAIINRKYS